MLFQYQVAWDDWLNDQRQRGVLTRSSATSMYAHMWGALAQWAQHRGIPPLKLQAADLQSYLAQRGETGDLSLRYAWRLLRLTERILAHVARTHHQPASQACTLLLERRPDIRYANASSKDGLPELFSRSQCARLVSTVRHLTRSSASPNWQTLRNCAALALQLGGGLSPGAVRSLMLANVLNPGTPGSDKPLVIQVMANGNSPAHLAPLRPWAGLVVKRWLHCREMLEIPGQQLLPSTRAQGKPWGKISHYDNLRKLLECADLPQVEGGSYRLRHSYALRQLERGLSPALLTRALGVSDPNVIERYQQVLLDDLEPPATNSKNGVQ
jgi:site-specific recombinase XerD